MLASTDRALPPNEEASKFEECISLVERRPQRSQPLKKAWAHVAPNLNLLHKKSELNITGRPRSIEQRLHC